MKKKFLLVGLILVSFIALTGCGKEQDVEEKEQKNPQALKFKEEYESLNEKKNSNDVEYRKLTISEENPFEPIKAEDLIKKMDDKETFYVYFGSELCPWCRSVIEKAIEVAKDKKIEKIYYVDIWDDEGNEILRSKFELDSKNKPKEVVKGTETYYELLERFDSLLDDYTLTTKKNKTVKVGEKRLFAPSFVYIKDGKAEKLVEGISDKQKDSTAELTEEILADQEKIFTEFFE